MHDYSAEDMDGCYLSDPADTGFGAGKADPVSAAVFFQSDNLSKAS